MLSPAALAVLGLSILGNSFLSGVFGMAGGLVLLGICLALLDVTPAMVLHAATPLSANGWRAFLWRSNWTWRDICETLAPVVGWVVSAMSRLYTGP
jgi:uncharacterized protein